MAFRHPEKSIDGLCPVGLDWLFFCQRLHNAAHGVPQRDCLPENPARSFRVALSQSLDLARPSPIDLACRDEEVHQVTPGAQPVSGSIRGGHRVSEINC